MVLSKISKRQMQHIQATGEEGVRVGKTHHVEIYFLVELRYGRGYLMFATLLNAMRRSVVHSTNELDEQ